MQVLEAPATTFIDDGHTIETFGFSTKRNEADWEVDQSYGHELADDAINHDFIIVPDLINKPLRLGGGGHYFGTDKYDDLIQGYANHSHGKIIRKKGPFYYNDGTNDYFYMYDVKLSGSKAAAALMEHGAKTWVPFAVSPHIWPLEEKDGKVTKAKFIGLALVIKGAYGNDAVVTKYCHGENSVCEKSLAASKLCAKEDASLAASISSLVLNNESKDIMSQVTVHDVNPSGPAQVNQTPNSPIKQEEKKEETVSLTKAEFEALNKQIEDNKQKDQQLSELIKENKTTKLNNIFKSVKDESLKKTLTEKYFNADVNQLNEFYADITNHVVPSLIEDAKAVAEQELKNKTIEENKGKSKAASTTSLPKEPEIPKEETKVVPKSENEVLKFDRLMRRGY